MANLAQVSKLSGTKTKLHTFTHFCNAQVKSHGSGAWPELKFPKMATTMDVQQLKDELDLAQKVNEQMRVDLDQAGHRVLELEAKMKVVSDMMESMKEKNVSEKKKWKLSEDKALFGLDCYEGDYKTYDDWKFKMKVFLSRREGMKDFLEWVTTEVKEPQDLKGFVQTYEVTSDVAKSLNEELYEVLCLKLRG